MASCRVRARILAPFGSIHVTLDETEQLRSVDLRAEPVDPHVPAGFPAAIQDAFEAYLDGEDQRPTVPLGPVDLTAFQANVYEALTEIEPGEPITYGELAHRLGKPGAARAVGQALRSNPLPLVWPCHRVVAADGLGGFGGASGEDEAGKLAIKRWLLDHERCNLA